VARRRPERRTADLRTWVSDLVRSGLAEPADVQAQVAAAIASDLPGLDAEATARSWVAAAHQQWRDDAAGWPAVTDYDRLTDAFAVQQAGGVVVLQGCEDHWSARDELVARDPRPRGIAGFTPQDVWHAVDEGMLEVNLWHGTSANAAPGDALLDDVIAAFAGAGLEAHFDEGRIEVAAHWQRRPPE
jgi:hypothetical protein